MNKLSAISEICVSYALLTVGTDRNESKIMRLRCADAARELGQAITADQILQSLDATPVSLNVERLREFAPDTDEYPTVA